MSVLLVSTDLMTSSRVEGAAARLNVPCQSIAPMGDAIERAVSGTVRLLLADLTSPSLDMKRLVERIRSSAIRQPTIIAFGPHVQKDRLDSARAAGCDKVLTRGQFFAEIDAILESGSP